MNKPWKPAKPINLDDKRKQVADQCRVVAHMARALTRLNEDFAKLFSGPSPADTILDQIGHRTAYEMELLGDVLNGRDAVMPEDDWVNPIMGAAQELWPQR